MDVNGRTLEKMNLWKCKNNHVLGVIKKKKVRNSSAKFSFRVTVVYLLRESVDTANPPEAARVAGRTRATPDLTWTCSICGEERVWEQRKNVYFERKEGVQ